MFSDSLHGDRNSAGVICGCTHCNAGGHTLQQCEYFANYTRGIAIAMQAIAEIEVNMLIETRSAFKILLTFECSAIACMAIAIPRV
jgi:hypothetical protein